MNRVLKIGVALSIGVLFGFGTSISQLEEEGVKEQAYCFLAKIYKNCQEMAKEKGITSGEDCRDEGALVTLIVVGEVSKKGIVGDKLSKFGGVVYSICTKGCLKDSEEEEKLREHCPSQFEE
ncbi:MAG: hypothetical protein ABGW77_01045 [Campylobacterales bacterium]